MSYDALTNMHNTLTCTQLWYFTIVLTESIFCGTKCTTNG